MRLASVRVEGAVHTRKSFLGSLINPFLQKDAPAEPQNLGSVLYDARTIGSLLQEADIFDSVIARVERSTSPLSQHGDVDLIFKTREKPRFFLKTSTEFGNNEGGAVSISPRCLVYAMLRPSRMQHVGFETPSEEQRLSRLAFLSGQPLVSPTMPHCPRLSRTT